MFPMQAMVAACCHGVAVSACHVRELAMDASAGNALMQHNSPQAMTTTSRSWS